jgi:hypothetical protein
MLRSLINSALRSGAGAGAARSSGYGARGRSAGFGTRGRSAGYTTRGAGRSRGYGGGVLPGRRRWPRRTGRPYRPRPAHPRPLTLHG